MPGAAVIGTVAGRDAEPVASVEVGHRPRDVEVGELPPHCILPALHADFPLPGTEGWQRHAGVVVLVGPVRHDLRLHPLAPTGIAQQPRLQRIAGGQPGRREALPVGGRPRAVGADAVAVEPREARAEPGREALVPADRVLQRQLGAALVAVGVGRRQRRVRRHDGIAIDMAGADVVVGLILEAVVHATVGQPNGQLMTHAAGHGAALEAQVTGREPAAFVVAAEVVEVEAAVGAIAVVVAFGSATISIGQPVVALESLLPELGAPAPIGVERLREAQRAGQRVEGRRL